MNKNPSSLFVYRHKNSELYEQIDGVAMDFPLGPLFANIFLAH